MLNAMLGKGEHREMFINYFRKFGSKFGSKTHKDAVLF